MEPVSIGIPLAEIETRVIRRWPWQRKPREMQNLIKRYFWLLGGVVVVVCAVFAAKATGHVLEAKFLADAEHGPKISPVVSRVDTSTVAVRTKEDASITTRNMFCSDCTPPVAAAQPSNLPGGGVPNTALPIALLATNISLRDDESYATIVNTENQKQGAYSIGDQVPGAASSGKIKEIHFKYVDFENNKRTERVMLISVMPPIAVASADPAPNPTNPPAEGDELKLSIDNGIKKVDDTHYEIDKALIEKVLLNPMAFAKGAGVVPSMKDGKPVGFKLYAIRPNSAFAKLGLSNGDTLQSINGFELTSADKALEVYTKLREATTLEIDVTRRGKPMSLNYSIK